MPERVLPGPLKEPGSVREAVCVHTKKIYDSCKDKDCVEDLRFYPCSCYQEYIDNAVSVRPKSAELLFAAIDVEEIPFNRGFYTIDIRFFYRVKGDAFSIIGRPCEICGLAIFDKRVILFGSEGNAKVFSTDTALGAPDRPERPGTNLPSCVVEAVDPIVLSMKIVEVCDTSPREREITEIPAGIAAAFGSPISLGREEKRIYVTIGQFSIVRLERDSQLLIPAYDYCMPEKECIGGGEEDPCDLFRHIHFPVDEFFPPDTVSNVSEEYREAMSNLPK